MENNANVEKLLYDHDCPLDYKCLAVDCLECLNMHMEQEVPCSNP